MTKRQITKGQTTQWPKDKLQRDRHYNGQKIKDKKYNGQKTNYKKYNGQKKKDTNG